MAPLVRMLQGEPDFTVRVCVTAQHRQMLDQVLGIFGITPDHDLDLMAPDQTLAGLTGRVLAALDPVLADFAPDLVVVQAGHDPQQGGLAGAVGPHDGVHLAGLHGKIDALEDLVVPDSSMEIADFEHGVSELGCAASSRPPPPR